MLALPQAREMVLSNKAAEKRDSLFIINGFIQKASQIAPASRSV
jgi:hypothetical protein